jgi:hypothetical protein
MRKGRIERKRAIIALKYEEKSFVAKTLLLLALKEHEHRTDGRDGSPKQRREPDRQKRLAVLPARAGPEDEKDTTKKGGCIKNYPKIIYTGQPTIDRSSKAR